MNLDELVRSIVQEVVRQELRPVVELLERLKGEGGAGDELLTPKQAAEVAKVKPGTLLAWRRAGALKNYGSARAPRYRRSELLNVRVEDAKKNSPSAVADRLLRRAG
jgi:hypothetical protein